MTSYNEKIAQKLEELDNNYIKSGAIYDNQVDAAKEIIKSFTKVDSGKSENDSRNRHVILLAQMQSGKTGVCNAVCNMLEYVNPDNQIKLSSYFGIKRYFFITGMNDVALRDQTANRVKNEIINSYSKIDNNEDDHLGKYIVTGDNIAKPEAKYFIEKNSDLKKEINANIEDCIVFIDESHYGSKEENVLTKFLKNNDIDWKNDPQKLKNNNIYIVSISATPFTESYSDKNESKPKISLETDNNYYGVKEFLDLGLIHHADKKSDFKSKSFFPQPSKKKRLENFRNYIAQNFLGSKVTVEQMVNIFNYYFSDIMREKQAKSNQFKQKMKMLFDIEDKKSGRTRYYKINSIKNFDNFDDKYFINKFKPEIKSTKQEPNIVEYLKDAHSRMKQNSQSLTPIGVCIVRCDGKKIQKLKNNDFISSYFRIIEFNNENYKKLNFGTELKDKIELMIKSASDSNKHANDNSNKPLLILIKGAFRAGITIPNYYKDYIYMIYDIANKPHTTAQGLLGRMCGYRSNDSNIENTAFYVNKDHAEKYADWVKNNFKRKYIPIKKKKRSSVKCATENKLSFGLDLDSVKKLKKSNDLKKTLSELNVSIDFDYIGETYLANNYRNYTEYSQSVKDKWYDIINSNERGVPSYRHKKKPLTEDDIGKTYIHLALNDIDNELYIYKGKIVKSNPQHKELYEKHKDTSEF